MKRAGLLAALTALAVGMTSGGGNLNQYHEVIGIRGRPNARLVAYFGGLEALPQSLDPAIAKILLDASSKRLRLACREMVNMWGTEMRGTAQMIPRVVTRLHTPQRQYLLTYTCFSTSPAIEAKYNDQRVALLTVDSALSSIATIPHADLCDNCTDLSRIESLEELTIGGKPGVRMELATASDNPCCGGADSYQERRIVYYVVDDRDLRLAASVPIAREAVSGDDVEGDSTAGYTAEVRPRFDSAASLTGFDVRGVLTEDSKRVTRMTVRYTWQADSVRFLIDTLR